MMFCYLKLKEQKLNHLKRLETWASGMVQQRQVGKPSHQVTSPGESSWWRGSFNWINAGVGLRVLYTRYSTLTIAAMTDVAQRMQLFLF